MATRTPLVLLTATAIALSGCLGTGEEPVTEGTVAVVDPGCVADCGATPGTGQGPGGTVDVPTWAVGDYWEYSAGADEKAPITYVVATASASEYLVLPTDEQTATYDATFDISFVGTTRASDLAGRQADAPVQFFKFPLTENLTWKTTWDGEERTLTATLDPAPKVAPPSGPSYLIVAKNESGAERVRYGYAPAVRWFTWMEFLNAQGEADYTVELTRHGSGFTGTVLEGTGTRVVDLQNQGTGPSQTQGELTLAETDAFLVILWNYGGAAQANLITLVDPTNAVHMVDHNAAVESGAGGMVTIAGIPGSWRYDFTYLAPPATSQYTVQMTVVALVPFTLGAAAGA